MFRNNRLFVDLGFVMSVFITAGARASTVVMLFGVVRAVISATVASPTASPRSMASSTRRF